MQRQLILALASALLAILMAGQEPIAKEAKTLYPWDLTKVKQYGPFDATKIKQIGEAFPVTFTPPSACNTIVANGCFDSWVMDPWQVPNDWTFSITQSANDYLQNVDNSVRIVTKSDVSSNIRTDTNVFENGKTYNISITCTAYVEGRLRLYQGNATAIQFGGVNANVLGVGTVSGQWTATADAQLVIYTHWSPNNTDMTFDDVLITEVP